jgi:hypothetical protein
MNNGGKYIPWTIIPMREVSGAIFTSKSQNQGWPLPRSEVFASEVDYNNI